MHDRRQADRDEAADEITRLKYDLADAITEQQWQRGKADDLGKLASSLTARVKELEGALEPFADMGRAMMGRKHPNEAVVQYALAPTIKVFHLVAAHEARAAITQETRDE